METSGAARRAVEKDKEKDGCHWGDKGLRGASVNINNCMESAKDLKTV